MILDDSTPTLGLPRAILWSFCRCLWPCDPTDLYGELQYKVGLSGSFNSHKIVGFGDLFLEYSLKIGHLVNFIFKFQKQVQKSHVRKHESMLKVGKLFTVSQNKVFCIVHWNISLSIILSTTMIQTVGSKKVSFH